MAGVLLVLSLPLLGCNKDRDSGAASPNVAAAPLSAPSSGGAIGDTSPVAGADKGAMSFFVSSQTNPNADLGGLSGADARCQRLASAVGAGSSTWHAYLSVAHDVASGNKPVNARDRIGQGPWYNQKGVLVAQDLKALHARTGDPEVFLDERGRKINGQWAGSPAPLEHDVLTGSDANGNVMADMTCGDWTGSSANSAAQVGHSDGLGPNKNGSPPYSSWNSAHANQSCADTAPRGGAGRIYCFAVK
jgi:hypothetical protein